MDCVWNYSIRLGYCRGGDQHRSYFLGVAASDIGAICGISFDLLFDFLYFAGGHAVLVDVLDGLGVDGRNPVKVFLSIPEVGH